MVPLLQGLSPYGPYGAATAWCYVCSTRPGSVLSATVEPECTLVAGLAVNGESRVLRPVQYCLQWYTVYSVLPGVPQVLVPVPLYR